MGHQIVKQPDGRLAIFSDGNDGGCWIRWDMTVVEVGDYYAGRAADSARESALRTARLVSQDKASEAYYQFTETFDKLNATSKYNGHTVLDGPVSQKRLDDLAAMDAEWDEMQERRNAAEG